MQKSGGALVLSGQVSVDMLQLSPRDMEYQASRTYARESISAVLGVPPSILGLPTANYALGRSQAVEYWSNQVKGEKESPCYSLGSLDFGKVIYTLSMTIQRLKHCKVLEMTN